MDEAKTKTGDDKFPETIIAVVSGKGGSGKTMVATTMAKILDEQSIQTLLIDADIATGGMTYYLGMVKVKTIAVGLSEYAKKGLGKILNMGGFQPIMGFKRGRFLGVGNHRKLRRDTAEPELRGIIEKVISEAAEILGGVTIVDCRGGTDDTIMAVCNAADQILLVVEPDTTSYQASRHLVERLAESEYAFKLIGFVINKAFSDPTVIIRQGTSDFRCQHLSTIPFDLGAAKEFLIGEIPSTKSLFGRHIWNAVSKSYPKKILEPAGRIWAPSEFDGLAVRDRDAIRGEIVVGALIALVLFQVAWIDILPSLTSNELSVVVALAILGLIGTFEGTKKAIGRIVYWLVTRLTK